MKEKVVRKILEALLDWVAMEEGREQYIKESAEQICVGANKILQLYLYLHEESVPDDAEHLRNTWKSIISDVNHHLIVYSREATSQARACSHLATAARVKYPAPLGRTC